MSRPRVARLNQSDAEINLLSRPAKSLLLPNITLNEGQQREGRLLFRPDGSGLWSCRTANYRQDRSLVWRTDFALQDLIGKALFGLGPFYGPRMAAGNSSEQYEWSVQFDFPTAYFNEIVLAEQNVGCILELPFGLDDRKPGPSTPARNILNRFNERNSIAQIGMPSFRSCSCS